jgi:hypothetical protein
VGARMSENLPRTRMDRLRDFWAAYVILAGIGGAVGGGLLVGFSKFTVYYLAEQSSVTTLAALSASSVLTAGRLLAIDMTLLNQKYTDDTVAKTLADLVAHVHALDQRADTDRQGITDALAKQDKNSQSILLLLQPKAR